MKWLIYQINFSLFLFLNFFQLLLEIFFSLHMLVTTSSLGALNAFKRFALSDSNLGYCGHNAVS